LIQEKYILVIKVDIVMQGEEVATIQTEEVATIQIEEVGMTIEIIVGEICVV
jgi:hypothetical protein